MKRGHVVWAGILLVGGAIEAYGIAHPNGDDTLSEFTRWAFRTDTGVGQAAFIAVWGAFAAWFAWHILDRKSNRK